MDEIIIDKDELYKQRLKNLKENGQYLRYECVLPVIDENNFIKYLLEGDTPLWEMDFGKFVETIQECNDNNPELEPFVRLEGSVTGILKYKYMLLLSYLLKQESERILMNVEKAVDKLEEGDE